MDEPFSIAQTDLFSGLSERESARLAAIGKVRVSRTGSLLLRVGATAEAVFVIKEGKVDVTVPLAIRGELTEARFESLGPGDTLGWPALIPPHRPLMNARAASPVVLLAFGREQLLQLMAAEPRISLTLVANLSRALGKRLVQMQALWVRQMQREVNESRC